MLCCSLRCRAELTGSIPPAISQLPNLKRLFMSFNRLSGTLDGCFCTKPNSTLEVILSEVHT